MNVEGEYWPRDNIVNYGEAGCPQPALPAQALFHLSEPCPLPTQFWGEQPLMFAD